MALARLSVGAMALTAFAAVYRRVRIPRGRPLRLVIAYGALWFGLYAVLINAAERYLDAGTTALVVNVAPIIIAVISGLFLGEGLPRALVAGLVIAFTGVVTIAVGTSTGRYDAAGVFLALGAAALYAVGVLLQKQALRDIDPFTATWLGCVIGALACVPFAPGTPRYRCRTWRERTNRGKSGF
jgi:drug/metabolite transporter (DMT)-like permease